MSSALIDELRHLEDVSLHPAIAASLIDRLKGDQGIVLPCEHKRVLQESNGIEVYAGYLRLFGLLTTESIDAVSWNEPAFWKCAWGGRCSAYWCFGETAWGDQYAYSLDSLRGSESPEVYLLDALSMTPQVIASCFDEFLEQEFIRSAKAPYDAMLRQARHRLGPLGKASHLVYMPSLLLGGIEDINTVQVMNARSAMICNGDIATQLDTRPSGKAVRSVQIYEDESRRTRLRLLWDL